MNNIDFKLGFVKRAMEYGLPESQAIRLVKQAVDFDLNHVLEAAKSGWNNLNPTAKGALIGGGVGLAGGALIPSEDEYGETHRLRNALLGGAGGAAVGAGGAHFYDKYKHYFNKLTSKPSKEVMPYTSSRGAYGNNPSSQVEESFNQFPNVDNEEVYGPVFDEAAQKDLLGDDYNEPAALDQPGDPSALQLPPDIDNSPGDPSPEEELNKTIEDPPDEYEYPTADEQLAEEARTRKIVAENERKAKLPFISRKLDALKQLAELDKARRNIGVDDYSDAGRRNRMTEMRTSPFPPFEGPSRE